MSEREQVMPVGQAKNSRMHHVTGRLRPRPLAVMALLALGLGLPSSGALAQEKTLKQQIVGAWTYVSVDTVRPDGSRTPMYGSNPQGLAIFDADGSYALLTARSDLPRIASNNRLEATPEEYKAIVHGSIAHFGRYTVNEADKTVTFRIATSTFPNWNGTVQTRPVAIKGDELKWITPGASGGGSGEVVLKRAR